MANNTGPYVTVQDIKDSTDVGTLSDAAIEKIIKENMSYIDMRTRNFFNEREITMNVEGNNSSLLHLGIPIIEIEYMKINGEDDDLPVSYYQVFNNRTYPDDRRNPRIKLFGNDRSIYTGVSRGTFLRGYMTTIKGKFGFIEEDGSTPSLIQKAVIALVVNDIKNPIDEQISSGTGGAPLVKRREKTDMHEIEYFDPNTGSSSITKSPGDIGIKIVDDVVKLYRAPTVIRGSIMDSPRNALTGY